MKVECEFEPTLVQVGRNQFPGWSVTCSRCDHSVELAGEDTPQLRQRLLQDLRRTCPCKESNRYVIPMEDIREAPRWTGVCQTY